MRYKQETTVHIIQTGQQSAEVKFIVGAKSYDTAMTMFTESLFQQ